MKIYKYSFLLCCYFYLIYYLIEQIKKSKPLNNLKLPNMFYLYLSLCVMCTRYGKYNFCDVCNLFFVVDLTYSWTVRKLYLFKIRQFVNFSDFPNDWYLLISGFSMDYYKLWFLNNHIRKYSKSKYPFCCCCCCYFPKLYDLV